MSTFVPLRRLRVASITQVAGGGTVAVGVSAFSQQPPRRSWQRRPWRTRLIWNTRRETWEVAVNCGFINGVDPTARGYPAEDAEAMPGTMGLLDSPRIPVPGWRDITGLGEAIPAYFQLRDVRKPRGIIVENESVKTDETPEEATQPRPRFLKAAEVWVEVSRPTYRLEVTVQGNLITGQLVDYTVVFDNSTFEQDGARGRLVVGSTFPTRPPISFQDRLAGAYQDEGVDRRQIATLFLLSPPNGGELPLSDWRPYIRHRTGWNLLHTAKNDPPKNLPQVTTGALGALVGRYTIVPQATQGAMEAEQQRIFAAILNETSNEGRFWHI